MIPVPARQRALSHADLVDRLGLTVSAEFSDPARGTRGLWDPARDGSTADLGRGLIDVFALALHVLWVYQEAWAAEGFVATAQLDASVDRLLYGIGYQPSPGTAAWGLQHFRCRAGLTATLPLGFALRSTGQGDEGDAVFETLEAIDLRPELNEVQVYLPSGAGGRTGTTATRPAAGALPGSVPPASGSFFASESLAQNLFGQIQNQRHGDAAARRAAKARQDALRFCDVLTMTKQSGGKCCEDAVQSICKTLSDAQAAIAASPSRNARPLSQSQEILSRQLKLLSERNAKAVALLETALARCEDEAAEEHAARLGAMAGFLDALVTGMIQDARDQVVLLRGGDALARLDRSLGATRAPVLGRSLPACDTLYLLGRGTGAPPSVRTGDWFVLAEDVETTDLLGNTKRERFYRQALRVTRASVGTPAGRSAPATQITFEPALDRGYELDRVVLIGNIAPVSAGQTVEETLVPELDGTLPLSRGPLTWLRDPHAPQGRRPEIAVMVGARRWERVDSLLDAASTDHVFVVEPRAGGGSSIRVGDGKSGAALPVGLPVRVRYRIGGGATGNRGSRRIDAPSSSHPAVEETWNPLAASGGTEPEPRALARVRGPAITGVGDRAIAIDDVRILALAFDGVTRARVLAHGTMRHRRLTVIVAGEGGAALPDEDLRELQLHLAARVPPRVAVAVENRVLVPVWARITLRVQRYADPLTVIRAARVRLGLDRALGEPLGLLDPDSVDLDDDLDLSRIYGALEGVDGLASLVVTALHRTGGAGLTDRISTTARELLTWARPDDGAEGVVLSHEEVKR
ncbi:Hypothetical protein A7982_01038 [Minicystis rosea]|nr:Hypothetical protein A7982_01038 [Minicystis rosea]